VPTRIIHLINPKTDSLTTTRPLYLNRALYSPLAGLLAVAHPFHATSTKWCSQTRTSRTSTLI